MNRADYDALRKDQFARLAPVREMLNSPQGLTFLKELRDLAYNPPGGVYVQGSFDATAFNLGIIYFYDRIAEMAKGLNDGRERSST